MRKFGYCSRNNNKGLPITEVRIKNKLEGPLRKIDVDVKYVQIRNYYNDMEIIYIFHTDAFM